MEKWLIEKIDGLKEHLASLQQEEEVKEDVQAVEDKTEEAGSSSFVSSHS